MNDYRDAQSEDPEPGLDRRKPRSSFVERIGRARGRRATDSAQVSDGASAEDRASGARQTPLNQLARLRAIRESLPETSERLSHGAPAFFYREKRCFLMLMDNHHGDGRLAIWCAAPAGAQELLVGMDPEKFFRPPYVGHRGWLGVMLHGDVDWDEIGGIVEDAYATVTEQRAR